jgi:chorismate mutase
MDVNPTAAMISAEPLAKAMTRVTCGTSLVEIETASAELIETVETDGDPQPESRKRVIVTTEITEIFPLLRMKISSQISFRHV